MLIYTTITRLGSSIYRLLSSTFRFFQKHQVLSLVLVLSFIMKIFLAGWNSYWLDELYSVYERGILFNSASDVLQHYRGGSSGNPLYEYILFIWMQLFGHSEVATRTLSIIYVTLSTLFLYLFTLKTFGRRVAVAASLLFTFSYMAVYYSLESRYYGQTLFLCTLSSYLLLHYLQSLNGDYSIKRLLINKHFILLTLANIALMLTFPFNYLFIVAQGLFVLLYFLYQNRQAKIIANLIKVSYIYLLQLTIMGLLWDLSTFVRVIELFFSFIYLSFVHDGSGSANEVGDSIVGTYDISIYVPYKDPFTLFMDNVVTPNFSLPVFVYVAFFLLFVYLIVKYGIMLYKRNIYRFFPPRKIYVFYTVLWVLIPCLLVFILFTVGKLDKLQPRYLIFCTPPLIVLVTLALEQGICLLERMVKVMMRFSVRRHYIRYSLVYAIIATIFLTLPGGYSAATHRKDDWRGIANQIVQQVHRDPEHDYMVIETAFRRPPKLDYYFKRFSDQVRVYDSVLRYDEYYLERVEDFTPDFMSDESIRDIEKHDYLVLAFTHHTINHFPQTIKQVTAQYELFYSQLDEDGRGYLVFNTQPDE